MAPQKTEVVGCSKESIRERKVIPCGSSNVQEYSTIRCLKSRLCWEVRQLISFVPSEGLRVLLELAWLSKLSFPSFPNCYFLHSPHQCIEMRLTLPSLSLKTMASSSEIPSFKSRIRRLLYPTKSLQDGRYLFLRLHMISNRRKSYKHTTRFLIFYSQMNRIFSGCLIFNVGLIPTSESSITSMTLFLVCSGNSPTKLSTLTLFLLRSVEIVATNST